MSFDMHMMQKKPHKSTYVLILTLVLSNGERLNFIVNGYFVSHFDPLYTPRKRLICTVCNDKKIYLTVFGVIID